MRIQSLIGLGVASVLVVALGAIATIASRLPASDDEQRAVAVAVAAKPLDRGCPDCGVVVAVKQVELKDRTVKSARQYQIRVRMSDGSVKTVTTGTAPAWKAGDRVRLHNGRLTG